MDKITATRDGQTRDFSLKQWEVMGIGKCGWSAVPEVPKEVVQTIVTKAAPIENTPIEPAPIKAHKKRRK